MEFQALESVDRKGGIQSKISDTPTIEVGIKQEELAKKKKKKNTEKERLERKYEHKKKVISSKPSRRVVRLVERRCKDKRGKDRKQLSGFGKLRSSVTRTRTVLVKGGMEAKWKEVEDKCEEKKTLTACVSFSRRSLAYLLWVPWRAESILKIGIWGIWFHCLSLPLGSLSIWRSQAPPWFSHY